MGARTPGFNYYDKSFRSLLENETHGAGVAQNRQEQYDPYAAANRSARAQFETFERDLGRGLEDMRGSQVGSGRLRTGFGYQDQDRLWEGAVEDLNRSLAERSMQAAGLDLQNIQGMQASRSLAAEMASGGMDRELQMYEIEKARKGGLGGFLGGALGGIGGFFLGGPMGAVAGANIGSSAGAGIGGYFS
jgi:hypothetical protein